MPGNVHLIGISGKQYAGKDVLADMLASALPGFRKIPLALAIKQAYANENGLTTAAIEADKARHRAGLIEMGDRMRRDNPNYWLQQVLEQPGDKIISDIRLRHEHAALRARDAFLIRLEADRDTRAQRGTLVNEADLTECDLDTVRDWDAVLDNNADRDALAAQVEKIMSRLRDEAAAP